MEACIEIDTSIALHRYHLDKRSRGPKSQSQIGVAGESFRSFQELSPAYPAASQSFFFFELLPLCTHYKQVYIQTDVVTAFIRYSHSNKHVIERSYRLPSRISEITECVSVKCDIRGLHFEPSSGFNPVSYRPI
jgi:hypothetical protein